MNARDRLCSAFVLALSSGCGSDAVPALAETTTSAGASSSSGGDASRHDLGTHDVPHWPSCAGFICPHDVGGDREECDKFAQDCPVGLKCAPGPGDNGYWWGPAVCVPIDPSPVGAGEPCTVQGEPNSGIDDCELGAMCWDIDAELHGVCVDFCRGSESQPTCDDPLTACIITDESIIIICLPFCNPLQNDCRPGHGCYPETFLCAPDASGDLGAWGDPCEYINVCDPGLFCANPEVVPGCTGSIGCCSDFCDITSPYADAMCGGALLGQICVPWYDEPGQARPGLVDVGACVLPQ